MLRTKKGGRLSVISHVLSRFCLLRHGIEGKIQERIEVTGRRGRRRKQLLNDLKERRGYWKLEEEALGRILWRTSFGGPYGSFSKQPTE